MLRKICNTIAKPEYYRCWALTMVLGAFVYTVAVKSYQLHNTVEGSQDSGTFVKNSNKDFAWSVNKATAEALLSLGSTFAIVISGSFAYSTLINNRFYELHKRFYSDEILKARQMVDTSIILRINEYKGNLDKLNLIYPTKKLYKSIKDGQKTEKDIIQLLRGMYLLDIDENLSKFSETKFTHKNIEYKNFNAFIDSLEEEYYMVLKFINFLNSACIAYDSRMVPYGKFIHAFGPILKSYWPYFTKAFVEHRKKVHEIQNGTPNEKLYEYLENVSQDMIEIDFDNNRKQRALV